MALNPSEIEADLHRAQQTLQSARERRVLAEQALWAAVRQSAQDDAAPQQADAVVAEYHEAARDLAAAEAAVALLRDQLVRAQEHEHRLMVVTDALIAHERTRTVSARNQRDPGEQSRTSRHRSLFDLFRRR